MEIPPSQRRSDDARRQHAFRREAEVIDLVGTDDGELAAPPKHPRRAATTAMTPGMVRARAERGRSADSPVLIDGQGHYENPSRHDPRAGETPGQSPQQGSAAEVENVINHTPEAFNNLIREFGLPQNTVDLVEDDAAYDSAMMEAMALSAAEAEARERSRPDITVKPEVETRYECVAGVTVVFPDICLDHVGSLYETVAQSSERLIPYILDNIPYPKAVVGRNQLKRKREPDPEEEAANKYGGVDRIVDYNHEMWTMYAAILKDEFPNIPVIFINATLHATRWLLYPSHLALDEAERTWKNEDPPYNKLKSRRKTRECDVHGDLRDQYHTNLSPDKIESVRRELIAARRVRSNKDAIAARERQEAIDEMSNLNRAQAEGAMGECGCCYSDYPLNRMVHCNNERDIHWFCRECALRNAETEIGNSKYELKCMSVDGCRAGFSRDQRKQFLKKETVIALDRLEMETNLRMAGIENLASCPFCSYAAEYPPIRVNKEFHCQAQDCGKVSCRLCNQESHLPKSCEEHAREGGLSVRRQIEEAMSAALIRKCNKCGTPFIKDEGCNKMTCTAQGCRNIQCYVCGKSCDYAHFNDRRFGGKDSGCPLFDNHHARHEDEVAKAEKDATAKIRAEHPEYGEDVLKVKVSEKVRQDEQRRREGHRGELIRANERAIAAMGLQPQQHPGVPGL